MRLLLLTGGSRGIGRAIGQTLATHGFDVVEFSRTAPYSHSVATDFASPLDAHHTVSNALKAVDPNQLEQLLVVSNAATLQPIGPVSCKPPDTILGNININFTSPVLFISAVIAKFQNAACRKVIANISAGAAGQGVFGWSLYCAAKVGMENFIRSLATEQATQLYPFVPVNIDPGVVDTDMHVAAASASLADFPAANRFAARRTEGHLTPPVQAGAAITKLLLSADLTPGGNYDARDVAA
jgi:benzil reductase ((S)-benzoin forming)